ncbi:MAG: hypothetical protein K2K58_00885 [Muribaculaceae bacterium]|nr:hypothetical protein [Muribaculaceae bacterium]
MKDTALINTESTSVYFNNIVKRNVEPITIADLSETTVAEFNRQVGMAFTEEQDITVRRVHYLIPYILQNIDW